MAVDPREALMKKYLKDTLVLIDQYQRNPDAFNDNEVDAIYERAQAFGIPFEPRSSIGRKIAVGLGSLADTAAFDLIPDDWLPKARTSGEKIASGVGSAAGFFTTPFTVGGKIGSRLAQTVTGGLVKGLGKVETAGAAKLLGGLGKAAKNIPKVGRPIAQEAVGAARSLRDVGNLGALLPEAALARGIQRFGQFGSAAALGDVVDVLSGEDPVDTLITDFFGTGSAGAIGGIIGNIAAKNPVFNLRNLARAIAVSSTGGEDATDAIENKLITLLSTIR
jgi:hypothetical protein